MASGIIDEEEVRSVLDAVNGVNDGVKRFSGTKDPVSGQKWFVVSMTWFLRWKQAKGLEPAIEENLPGPVDNSDVVMDQSSFYTSLSDTDYRNVIVKPGLSLGLDFLLLPEKCWKLLVSRYNVKGPVITRYSVSAGAENTEIEVLLKPVLVSIIPKRDQELVLLDPKPIYVSKRDDQNRLKERLLGVYNTRIPDSASKGSLVYSALWKLEPGVSLADLTASLASATEAIECPGTLIPREATIDSCQIASDEIVLLELWVRVSQSKSGDKRFLTPRPNKVVKCAFCNNKLGDNYKFCTCAQLCYCDEGCLRKDIKFHDCSGAAASTRRAQAYAKAYDIPTQVETAHYQPPKTYIFSERSMNGLMGLQNLGNSCYMNSALQCLLHTAPLATYFLSDQHLSELNQHNPIGAKGELAKALGTLYKEVWMGASRHYAPWDFKRTLAKFLRQFDGYNQHDSHEFLIFAMDLIHEDLNRVRIKPITRDIVCDGIPEPELKQLFWIRHLERNDSKIVDLMHGMYRSEIECPRCARKSLIFDPFITLSVTLPTSRTVFQEVFFIPIDCALAPKRLRVRVQPYFTVAEIRIQVSSLMDKQTSSLVVAIMNMQTVWKLPHDDQIVSQKDSISVFETPNTSFIFLNIRKETEDRLKPASITRLVPIPPSALNPEVFESVFRVVARITKRESELDFIDAFPHLFQQPGVNFFNLNYMNLTQNEVCRICGNPACRGCPVSFESGPQLMAQLSLVPPEVPVLLEAVLPDVHSDCLKMIKEPQVDASWDERRMNLSGDAITIEDCLDCTFSKEQLDASNSIFCPVCSDHVQAYRKLSLSKLPQVLILQLKRFFHTASRRSKDDRNVLFPLKDLDLSHYLFADEGDRSLYDLYAVSYHHGDLSSGHYTAACKLPNGAWFSFNDSYVTSMKEEDVVTSGAYLLFYQLKEV